MDNYDKLKFYARKREAKIAQRAFQFAARTDLEGGPPTSQPPLPVGTNVKECPGVEEQTTERWSGTLTGGPAIGWVNGCPPPWPPDGFRAGAGLPPVVPAEGSFTGPYLFSFLHGTDFEQPEDRVVTKTIGCVKKSNLGSFVVAVGLLKFDTSEIPDTAVITGATLKLTAAIPFLDNEPNVCFDWHPWTGPHASDDDWIPGDGSLTGTAHPGTSMATLAKRIKVNFANVAEMWDWRPRRMEFPLINAGANISKTGPTYLRCYLDGGAPTYVSEDIFTKSAQNSFTFISSRPLYKVEQARISGVGSGWHHTVENIGAPPDAPKLIVNYA